MKPEKLIEVLSVAERLKDAVRHSYTSGGRRESVAEHSWRITLMAYFVSDEFPEADLLKIMKMCSSMIWEKLLPGISQPLKKRIRIRRKKPMCWENG